MIIDLRLQNFRSYQDESFEFQPGVNIIVGPNGSGKTNLLEAILMIASGGSYRAKDVDLIAFGKHWARLDAQTEHDGDRVLKLVAQPTPTKHYEISGKRFQRLSLQHSIPLVLFEPNHLQLLSGSPEQRRVYLDDLLEQMVVGYGTTRRQYRRFLAQRNALLKQTAANQTLLFPWNLRLSELAGQIVRCRCDLVEQLRAGLQPLYKSLSRGGTIIGINYGARFSAETYESRLLHALETTIETDKLRGFTSVGPHREDLLFTFNNRPSAETASRGEVRTLVLGLKILELQFIEQARSSRPILLLDDVFSELDGARRNALTNYLREYQTFISTTDADIVIQHFTETTHVIPLNKNSDTAVVKK